MAMGQDCSVLGEVCGWINAKATIPVWAKMTPNITDITQVRWLKLDAISSAIVFQHHILVLQQLFFNITFWSFMFRPKQMHG